MVRYLFLLIIIFSFSNGIAQNEEKALDYVRDGITLFDKGKYEKAINRYELALKADAFNFHALYEKAYALYMLKNYAASIDICKVAIEKHPDNENLKSVYIVYGSALDDLNQKPEAIAKYDEGLQLFPTYYLLHYNKAITLVKLKDNELAINSLKESVMLKPNHASSHYLLSQIMLEKEAKIPAIMAMLRFLSLEPTSERAKNVRETLDNLFFGHIGTPNNKNKTSVTISGNLSDDTSMVDNFKTAQVFLDISAALVVMTQKDANLKSVEIIKNLCSGLNQSQDSRIGFFWDYYASYFIALHQAELTTTFAYLINSYDNSAYKWLKSNMSTYQKLTDWNKKYVWYSE